MAVLQIPPLTDTTMFHLHHSLLQRALKPVKADHQIILNLTKTTIRIYQVTLYYMLLMYSGIKYFFNKFRISSGIQQSCR